MFFGRLIAGALFLLAALPAHAMYVKAPDVAENGAVVPVEFGLDNPLTPGQYIEVSVNGRVATQVRVIQGSLTVFSTRFKFCQTGSVTGRVIANGREIDSASKEVKVTIGGCGGGGGEPTTILDKKIRAQNGDLKLLMMSENGFAGTLVLQDSGFRAEVIGSSVYSKNPYIGVKGSFSDAVGVSFGGGQVFSNPVPPPAPAYVPPPQPAYVPPPAPAPVVVKNTPPKRVEPAKAVVKNDAPKKDDGGCAKVVIVNGKKICDE